MIGNSLILSYNKIQEIEEFKPILPPDSIYLSNESKNLSFQHFLPDVYDLYKIESPEIKYEKNLTPINKNKIKLKNYFFNSIMVHQIDKKDSINTYHNETERIINLDDYKSECFINKNEIIKPKDNLSASNINNELLDSEKISLNIFNHKINKIERGNLLKEKNIFPYNYNYKNIVKKYLNKENNVLINTSFYKKNKHIKENNYKPIKSETSKNSSEIFVKLEETKNISNLKYINKNQKNIKEEILKKFMISDSNSSINTSKIDQSNFINNFSNMDINTNTYNSKFESIHNNTNLNKNETETGIENIFSYCEKNNVNLNDLNDIKNIYKFNKNILNSHYQKLKILNSKNNNPSILNTVMNNMSKNNMSKKSSIGVTSLKKFNFDFPKILLKNDINKEKDNKSKSFISQNKISIFEQKYEKKEKPVFKTPLVNIKFKNLKKILNNNGLFNILTFLDNYDLLSLLQTNNKSLLILINKSITKPYYFKIKTYLNKFKSFFELLKCSLFFSKIKNSVKIDFVINIRFTHRFYKQNKKKIINDFLNLNLGGDKKMEPKCFQIIYFYKYYKLIIPQKGLITKESIKNDKMYDYYTYDLYSENDKFPNVYINKEKSSFNSITDKLVFVQPILPFRINDKGIINFEIYSSNNQFINPSSIKIILKNYELKKYINDLKIKGYNNLRICEYENICFHWKYIDSEINNNFFKDIIDIIKQNFEPYFQIGNISYESIGFFIFKINLIAVKEGKIDNEDFGINIIIRNKKEIIENEIKKNNLLLERRDIYELRVGETLIFYYSTKNKLK